MREVICVLRSGGDYRPGHVVRLQEQVMAHLPGARFRCISDAPVPCERLPMQYKWPGWWSKMEMFRPEIEGDILYIDLDTAVVGSLADVAAAGKLTVLSDFYKPEMIGSGLMFWPEEERARIWRAWIGNPERHMRRCRTREKWGDQGFLQPLVLDRADRWQDVLPGQVVSYKLHVRPARMHGREFGTGKVPPGARLICFHGRPRPWHAGW